MASMDDALRDLLRAQRRGGVGFNLADWGRLAAWLFLIGAACFWMPIEWSLVNPQAVTDMVIAVAFGVFMTVGPAIIVSSFIPSSRAGRLLLKLNIYTPGKVVGIGSGLFLTWHAYSILLSWWAARPSPPNAQGLDLSVNGMGLTWQLATVGIICTIIYPALMFAPVSKEELSEQVEQAEQVELYEVQTRNRIAAIMAAHERALDLFAKGLANMAIGERDELAQYMVGVVGAIDESRRRLAGQIEARTGVALQYQSLTNDPNLVPYLHYVTQALRGQDGAERSADVADQERSIAPLQNVGAASGRAGDVLSNVVPLNVADATGGSQRLSEPRADQATLAVLRATFARGSFMVRDLDRAFPGIGESTGGKLIAELSGSGHIESLKTRGYYRLTEREVTT